MQRIPWIAGFVLGWLSALVVGRVSISVPDGDWARWALLSLMLGLAAMAMFLVNAPAASPRLTPAFVGGWAGIPTPGQFLASSLESLRGWRSVDQTPNITPPSEIAQQPQPAAGEGAGSPAPPEPATELELLLERMGERYLADLKELHDAFERLYAPQLEAKETEIRDLQGQIEQLTHQRDALLARVQDLEQSRTRFAENLEAVSGDLTQRLAAVLRSLDQDPAVGDEHDESPAGTTGKPGMNGSVRPSSNRRNRH